MNASNHTYSSSIFIVVTDPASQCPDQRAISRPLLFIHNYSLFFFGSVLNILAFIILMQGSLRCHSTFAYLAFLSLSNGLLSLVRFTQWMLTYYLQIHIEYHLSACRFSRFTLDFLTHFSLFTLVCVNIDRAQTVTRTRPNRTFSNSPFRSVLIKELFIAITLTAYHLHFLVKFGHEVFDGKVKEVICNYDQNRTPPLYLFFLSKLYRPLELVVFFCVPLLINMICTSLIVRSLHLRMRTARRFSPHSRISHTSNQSQLLKRTQQLFSCLIPRTTTKSDIYSCFCFQIQCRRHTELRLKIARSEPRLLRFDDDNDSSDRQQTSSLDNEILAEIQQLTAMTANILNKTRRTRRIRDIHLSAMLIVLNILYLIFNLPFTFYQAFGKHIYRKPPNICVEGFTNLLLDALQQTYFSTNFFLYVLTNRRFREEFCNTMMKLCARKQQYLLRRNMQQRQAQSLSLIPSTAIISNFNGDYQTVVSLKRKRRDSLGSDIELTQPSTVEQQTVLSEEGNNVLMAKLAMLKTLADEHV